MQGDAAPVAVAALVVQTVAALATAVTVGAAKPVAAPELEDAKYDGYTPNSKEMLFAAKHTFIANDVGAVEKGSNNISTVAHRFASTGQEKIFCKRPNRVGTRRGGGQCVSSYSMAGWNYE